MSKNSSFQSLGAKTENGLLPMCEENKRSTKRKKRESRVNVAWLEYSNGGQEVSRRRVIKSFICKKKDFKMKAKFGQNLLKVSY